MVESASQGKWVEKPWGGELLWALTDNYAAKILYIREGLKLSLQYHREKDESIRVLKGRLRLHIANGPGEGAEIAQIEMGPGESYHVPTGFVHRFEALEDTELVEVSTPELDDVVRLADDYGREDSSMGFE